MPATCFSATTAALYVLPQRSPLLALTTQTMTRVNAFPATTKQTDAPGDETGSGVWPPQVGASGYRAGAVPRPQHRLHPHRRRHGAARAAAAGEQVPVGPGLPRGAAQHQRRGGGTDADGGARRRLCGAVLEPGRHGAGRNEHKKYDVIRGNNPVVLVQLLWPRVAFYVSFGHCCILPQKQHCRSTHREASHNVIFEP